MRRVLRGAGRAKNDSTGWFWSLFAGDTIPVDPGWQPFVQLSAIDGMKSTLFLAGAGTTLKRGADERQG